MPDGSDRWRRPSRSGPFNSATSSAPTRTLKNLDLEIKPNEIFGIIGPAGSGKSTFLRALNRLNDLVPGSQVRAGSRWRESISMLRGRRG